MTVHKNWKPIFLEELAKIPNIQAAAKAAGISRQHAYVARDQDEEFASAWEIALEDSVDKMESEAHRRAVEGCSKPVYQGGKQVGNVQEYSDTLMIFLLKAHRPEKYRERHEVTMTDTKRVDDKISNLMEKLASRREN